MRIGNGYFVLTIMLLRPQKLIQGWRDLFFFSTKKDSAPTGEEDGWIIPAIRESVIVGPGSMTQCFLSFVLWVFGFFPWCQVP